MRDPLMMDQRPSAEDVALAEELLRLWDGGRGVSKSQLEIKTWDDATSHGRHFDRFVRSTLGIETTRRSKQSDRIGDLERQVRGLGGTPIGRAPEAWEIQLQHARDACLGALRVWNDPTASFRTGAFSLMFVTAWNGLAMAMIQRSGGEWRKLDDQAQVVTAKGAEQARDTADLVAEAFEGDGRLGLRENVAFWIDLRNAVAHRHLPSLDISVIPWAQSGLLNLEGVLVEEFGAEYGLAERLSVPLQLTGFRDPGVLSSRKQLQASLPLDVQAILSQAESAPPELLTDPTFVMRVAFVPVVPSSGRSPDSVAYFVPPGEVPAEVGDAIEQFVVLAKPVSRAELAAMEVVKEVKDRIGFKFNVNHHAAAARALGAWPAAGEPDRTVNLRFAEYISSFKRYVYTRAWVECLVSNLGDPDRFKELTGKEPVSCGPTRGGPCP